MSRNTRRALLALCCAVGCVLAHAPVRAQGAIPARHAATFPSGVRAFDVRSFGAKGDSASLDTDAINRAIEAAAAAGGGTVYFPSGVYSSFSIHLKSNVALYLDQGVTLLAANPAERRDATGYDPAEPSPGNEYQDYGHSHWHNSLIWGENVDNVSIMGPGRIDGRGMSRSIGRDTPRAGNKAIALKRARNVTLRDFFSNVVAYDADPRYASTITGIPGHPIEDVRLSNIRIQYRGGLTLEHAAKQPADMVRAGERGGGGPRPDPYAVAEQEKIYPEPSMFGIVPAYGFYVRHVKGLQLDGVEVGFDNDDTRPAFVLDDVHDAEFHRVRAQKSAGVPTFVLRDVEEFRVMHSRPVADRYVRRAARLSF